MPSLSKSLTSLLFACCLASLSAQVSPAGRVTSPVSLADTVSLAGTVSGAVAGARDLGRVPAGQSMGHFQVMLAPTREQKDALATAVDKMHDSASPLFHQWISPAQIGVQYGVADADIAQVSAWLTGRGLTVNHVSRSKTFLDVSGTAGAIEAAFSTEMHFYDRNGARFLSNSKPLRIPAALLPVIAAVAPLASRSTSVAHATSLQRSVPDGARPDLTTSNGTHYLAPGDFATIYDLNPLYKAGLNGTGQKIAIVGHCNINLTDVAQFRTLFNLPSNMPTVILNGEDPGLCADYAESTLDVEWAGATAPNATVYLVATASVFDDGISTSAQYIIDNQLAPVLSVSYSECEQASSAVAALAYTMWQQAAAEGITVIASAGDSGGANCDNPSSQGYESRGFAVNALASTPYNVAVGGTQFVDVSNPLQFWALTSSAVDQTSALSYIPETVWNESTVFPNGTLGGSIAAGGGGVSTLYRKPAWQAGLGVPADGKRDLPDLAFSASVHDAYFICVSNSCQGNALFTATDFSGGTSVAAPAFAGIMALINQKTASTQGVANYVLYSLAARHPEIFHDITTGNNEVPDANGNYTAGFNAGPGYDLASGWGSVDAALLVNGWAVASGTQAATLTLTAPAASVVHGSGVTLSSVISGSAGSPLPTGQVAFLADGVGVGNATLSNGTASATVLKLTGGKHVLSARYTGDALYAPASSANTASVTVTPEPSLLYFADAYGSTGVPFNLLYGQTVQPLAVLVAGASGQGYPTGNVTITEGASTLLTLPLQYGESSINGIGTPGDSSNEFAISSSTHVFPVGSHTLTATFPGDASFNPSSTDGKSTAPLNFTVLQSGCTTGLGSPTILAGVPSSISVSVLPNVGLTSATVGPGTFTLTDITNAAAPVLIGSATYNHIPGQSASQPIPFTINSTGQRYIEGKYLGDSNVTSCAVIVSTNVISSASSSTSVSTSAASVFTGLPVIFTAKVVSFSVNTSAPTGTVTFLDAGTVIGSATLTATGATATATLTTSTLTTGVHSITVSYSGDKSFAASATSAALKQSITDFSLSLAPGTLAFPYGQAGITQVVLAPLAGFNQPISLTCATVAGVACTLSQLTATPDGLNPTSVAVTISTVALAGNRALPRGGWKPWAAEALAASLLGLLLPHRGKRKRLRKLLALLLICTAGMIAGCNNTVPAAVPVQVGPHTFTITGSTTNGPTHTASLQVAIEQI